MSSLTTNDPFSDDQEIEVFVECSIAVVLEATEGDFKDPDKKRIRELYVDFLMDLLREGWTPRANDMIVRRE